MMHYISSQIRIYISVKDISSPATGGYCTVLVKVKELKTVKLAPKWKD